MASPISPLTGIIEEDKVYIDFGEHEGKSVLQISDENPDFYDNLIKAKDVGNFAIRRNKDKSFRLFINTPLQ